MTFSLTQFLTWPQSPYLALLLTTEFEMLAAFNNELMLTFAGGAFQTEDNLLGSFSLSDTSKKAC